jgi:predicted ATPase
LVTPGRKILSFDGPRIEEIDYEQLANTQIVRRFLNDRERFLQELLKGTPRLFKDEPE